MTKVGKTLILNVEKALFDELMKATRKVDQTRKPVFVGLLAGCPIWVYPPEGAPGLTISPRGV
jgi:hypothetical protein